MRETKLKELERRIAELENRPVFQFNGHVCESDGLQYLSYPPQWKCKICGKFYQYPNAQITLQYPHQNPQYPTSWA